MCPDRPDVLAGEPIGVVNDKLLEAPCYIVDCLQDLSKGVADETISGCLDDSPFKRYVEGKLSLHLHLRISTIRGQNDLGKYCVLFASGLGKINVKLEDGNRAVHNVDAYTGTLGHRCGHSEQLMFVSRVQFLKRPEQTAYRIRSSVRLQLADFCARTFVNPAQSPFHIVELLEGIVDRKHSLSVGEIAASQSPRDVVERAPNIVNAVADDCGPTCLWERLKDIQPEQILGLFSVVFGSDRIGIATQKSLTFCVEGVEVFFPSTKLVPTFP